MGGKQDDGDEICLIEPILLEGEVRKKREANLSSIVNAIPENFNKGIISSEKSCLCVLLKTWKKDNIEEKKGVRVWNCEKG